MSPFRTGFCNPGNDEASHARCRMNHDGDRNGLHCSCECHQTSGAEGAPEGPETPTVTEPATSAPESAGRAPGLYYDLPEDEYHGDAGSISVTGMKRLLKAPALFRYELEHPVRKDAWDLGTVAHKMILGTGPKIDIVEMDDWRTKAAQEVRDKAREEGRVALLRKHYDACERMADAVLTHHIASQLLTGGQAEVSAFREDEETGIGLRSRFDYVIPGALVDVKTAASADPYGLARVVINNGYDMQDAHYREMGAKLGLDAGTFAFVFVETAEPHLVTVCQLDGPFIERGHRRVRAAIERYRDCMATDTWPGYLTNFTTIGLPGWANDDTEVLG